MRTAFVLLGTLFSISCATTQSNNRLSLQNIEKFKVNETTSNDVQKELGPADIENSEVAGIGREVWLYLDKDKRSTQASFIFDSNTKKLEAHGWAVSSKSPESTVAEVVKRYPNLKFERQVYQENSHHYGSNQVHYVSSQKEMTISMNKNGESVEWISWSIPSRAPSNSIQK